MNEEQNIKQRQEDNRPPTTDDSEKSAEGKSFSSEENEAVANENIQHLTPNIQPNKENMEVHHRHHVHHKKKWAEYLLEFFMLFLAVFLGFVAENMREHGVEKKRLSNYMKQMIENIKADTGRCKNALVYNANVSKNLDSLRYEINSAVKGKANANRMYYLYIKYVRGNRFSTVYFKQGAITQLKSSGNMRLIENKTLTNEIFEYYDRWILHLMQNKVDVSENHNILNQMSLNFFNLYYFDEHVKRDTIFSYLKDNKLDEYFNAALNRTPLLLLLNNNAEDLQKLNNTLADFEETLHKYNSYLRVAQNIGDSLISHIQKEYHLENE
jgi:hypothetical protein